MRRRRRRRSVRNAGLGRARTVLRRAIEDTFGDPRRVDVASLRRLGRGLSREGYRADLVLEPPSPDETDPTWIVLLPCHDAEPGYDRRAQNEAKLLERLAGEDLEIQVPRLIALLDDGARPALVETAVFGLPLDLRAGRHLTRPWETVAWVAANVHGLDPARYRDLNGHPTRRHHGDKMLAVFEGLDEPIVDSARAWAMEHRPPDVPGVLVHGDLLGQNIIIYPSNDEAPGLIDWEYAGLGDPAHELAIVTRGVRRPFKVANGMTRLLEAYTDYGGQEITEADVRFYEICLAVRWYRESLGPNRMHPPEEELRRLRSVLSLAEVSS